MRRMPARRGPPTIQRGRREPGVRARRSRRSGMRGLAVVALLGLASAVLAAPAGRDLHEYWDARCGYCHGDSADFARRTLAVRNDRLVGKHHQADLELFLRHHYLADDLVTPVMAMLAAQATTPPVFKQRCAKCHGSAASFARAALEWRGSKLSGRKTRRDVADYLVQHGGLSAAEAATMTRTLERVLRETGAN